VCGIAGLVDWPTSDLATVVQNMSGLVGHRGPDGEGLFIAEAPVAVGFAHRRLAIIDLSVEANQPFEKDGLVITYNGELYNYRELRAELAARGVRFRSQSDTEVVLEAWRREGPGCLRRFRGMFAFAVLDLRTGRVDVARDRFGIKPLFLSERERGLAFASELKALRPALGEMSADPAAIVASFLYYWIPESHCAVTGVRKLPPGCWAEKLPGQSLRIHRYFDPPAELAGFDGGVEPGHLLATIEGSVAAHLVADVPVSTFLSGGLDSSLITALAQRGRSEMAAYTISFRPEDLRLEAMPHDLPYARLVARRFGIKLNEIEIRPEVADLLPLMVKVLDEPIGDPAAINTFLICQAARDAGTKVLLSGMGADELFGGYRKHYACLLAARYRRLPAAGRTLVERGVRHLPVAIGSRGVRSARWAKRFLSFASLDEEAAFRRSYTQYEPDDLASLLSPDLAPYVRQIVDEHADVYNSTGFDDPVNKMCMTDLQLFLVGLNLAYTDRASMAASVEVRVPFVDVEVVSAAFRTSGAQKIAGRERKAILKQAAEPVLPSEIVNRPKGLFSAPLRAWIRRDLVPVVDDLSRGRLVDGGFVRPGPLADLIREDRTGKADRAKEIWHLLTLDEWMRQLEPTQSTSGGSR
jgi:asparagine synthase (glutamine-hydrolysing)